MFTNFNDITATEWQEKLKKDLKDKAEFDDLYFNTSDGLHLAPFYTIEAQKDTPEPLNISKITNTWLIQELITVHTVEQANREALEALQGGAESLQFLVNNAINVADMKRLLDSVFLEMVRISFTGQYAHREPLKLWYAFCKVAQERGLVPDEVRLSIAADPIDTEQLGSLLDALDDFPYIQVVDLYGVKNNVQQLKGTLAAATTLLTRLPKLANRLQVSLPVGTSFMLELAKFRAFRQIWQRAHPDIVCPVLHGFTVPAALTDDVNRNKIAAATQAMSAVLGGADILTITPADAKTGKSDAFNRRIARNVHHLLRLESHLDGVVDAASGSYYIEEATKQLVELVFKK